jgi:enoyl-CoA hydratase
MDPSLLEESHRVIEELSGMRPRAVVLTGREGFFSAGVDLKVAPTLDAAGQRAMVAGVNRLFGGWYSLPHPVVCAVNGHAIAGGLILALCGDYRVCSTVGKLGLTELRAGIPYPAAAIAVVNAELAPRAARLLVLGADLIDPATALELGCVDEQAAPEEVLPRALAHARELAKLPPAAYGQIKRQLRKEAIARIERAISGEDDPLLDSWLSPETADAASATLQGER